MDLDDMFALITCICRHTTCGPIINAELYITYAFFNNVSLPKYSGHSERWATLGIRALAKKRVGNITSVCMCVCNVTCVYVADICPATCALGISFRTFLKRETLWRIARSRFIEFNYG